MHAVHGCLDRPWARFLRGCAVTGLLALVPGCSEDPVTVGRSAPPPPPAHAVLDDLEALALETLPAPIPTHYSPGHRERAEELQAWLRDADAFFQDRLRVSPEFSLAVLSPEHWAAISFAPYGVPFFTEAPRVVVMPAVPEAAVVTHIYNAARVGLPASAAAELEAVGVAYEDAVFQVLDLIGFHEVGHVYIAELGYDLPDAAPWLMELLATYAAYSYLDVAQPSSITVWDALSEAILGFVEPASRSLDDFNSIYVGLDPATYGWFQSHYNLRATEVLKQRPRTTWLAQLAGLGLDEDTRAMPTSELLLRLRGLNPSFTAWADAVGLEYE